MYRGERARGAARGRDAVSRALAFRRAEGARRPAASTPSASDGGWLNRALAELERDGDARGGDRALPRACRSCCAATFDVSTWAPSQLPDADADLLARVRRMYEASDPRLADRLIEALDARAIIGPAHDRGGTPGGTCGGPRAGVQIAPIVTAAARFLKSPNGPRVAAIDVGGWDTHANQGAGQGNLALRLRGLDAGSQTLKTELGPVWHAHDGADRHRVRPHGRRERHARHRPRHGGLRVPRGRRREAAAACSPTGQASRSATCTKAATCARRPTCAACSKACWARGFGVPEAALETRVFPGSAGVEPLSTSAPPELAHESPPRASAREPNAKPDAATCSGARAHLTLCARSHAERAVGNRMQSKSNRIIVTVIGATRSASSRRCPPCSPRPTPTSSTSRRPRCRSSSP